MTAYFVYQPRLTDEQVDEVNNGIDPHNAYMRTMFMDLDNAWERVEAALSYYSHAATVEADDVEQVFEVTNIGPESAIKRHGPMRSGSVGDVIISALHDEAYICLPMGWYEMTREEMCTLQCRVTTVMQMGEKIASAG